MPEGELIDKRFCGQRPQVESGELRTERFCGQGPQVESGELRVENGELRTERLPSGAECLTYDNSVAYVNGVSEALFKVGMCLSAGPYVSDDDVRYIAETIKAAIEG